MYCVEEYGSTPISLYLLMHRYFETKIFLVVVFEYRNWYSRYKKQICKIPLLIFCQIPSIIHSNSVSLQPPLYMKCTAVHKQTNTDAPFQFSSQIPEKVVGVCSWIKLSCMNWFILTANNLRFLKRSQVSPFMRC